LRKICSDSGQAWIAIIGTDVTVLPNEAECTASPNRADTGWLAQLSLEFKSAGERTLLTGRRHTGPLMVQRPFYPEGRVCHVYIVHPPGGVAGGDRLTIDVNCGSGSEALITTPAAGKFYRSAGKLASYSARIRIDPDAALEWLPQESILFDQTKVESRTRFDLDRRSTLIGWEILCLGRPACAEGFTRGTAAIGLEIWRDRQPLLVERMALHAGTLRSICGLNGRTTVATMFIYPAGPDQLDQVRAIADGRRFFGATRIENLLICRMLDEQAEPVRNLFESIWSAVRPALTRREAVPPRVWAT
jgi:urease accessory protein